MGKYSDSEEEQWKRKKKYRSPSPESQSSYSSSRHSKSKKSKKSKHKLRRSRSRSPAVYSRRHSRSHSRSPDSFVRKRSRSPSWRRSRTRSRSADRVYRKRSRSRSYDRKPRIKSRSRSRGRTEDSSRSGSHRVKRSRSRSLGRRPRRRSSSMDRDHSRRSHSGSRSKSSYHDSPDRGRSGRKHKEITIKKERDPCSEVPGFDSMTSSEQAQVRMQLALKAAAAADEKIKAMGSSSLLTMEEQQTRAQAIEDIEGEDFRPAAFRSSRSDPPKMPSQATSIQSSHDSAIYGVGPVVMSTFPAAATNITNLDAIAHPRLNESTEDKMDKWCKKLEEYRRRKLEGEAYG